MLPEFTPHMTAGEVSLLSEAIPQESAVLEFGSGGSTKFFLERGVKRLVSIDSDRAWLEALLTNPAVFTFHKCGRWFPLYADIGKTENWGIPADKTPQISWLNYHQNCWSVFPERNFDVILIDGRFRVACLCQCLLRCSCEKTLLAVHDFQTRPQYHGVLAFLDVVAEKDSLGIFKPKPVLDWRGLSLLLQDYQFIFE